MCRNLRQDVAGDWDYSSHAEFIKTLSGKPDCQPLQALSINTQQGLGCVGAPSQWQEMELHEYMAKMLGDNSEYLEQLRRAALQLNGECLGTVPYESDMLKDAFSWLRNLVCFVVSIWSNMPSCQYLMAADCWNWVA